MIDAANDTHPDAHKNHCIKLMSGTSNVALAKRISQFVNIPLTHVAIKKFSDGEIYVQIQESVRGHDVFLIQSTCAPTNDNLMELLLIIDALKRASAKSIAVVTPYFGYARQDRKSEPRESISAKLVADILTKAGATRLLTMDLHAPQLQGFFDIPVDDLWAAPILSKYLTEKKLADLIVVSPDIGGARRARTLAKLLGCPIALIDKRRSGHNVAEVMHIVGEVKGKTCVLIDDIIDTAGTIVQAAVSLKKEGAKEILIACTHGVLSGQAVQRLASAPVSEIILTDTIPVPAEKQMKNMTIISVAPLLAQAIHNIAEDVSVSSIVGFIQELDDEYVLKKELPHFDPQPDIKNIQGRKHNLTDYNG